MPLPKTFPISQSCLQDYMDCPRRFELRYILRQQWPALQSEPVLEQERLMEMGQHFHHMVQQHQAGLDSSRVVGIDYGPELARWWNRYLNATILVNLPADRYVEHELIAPFQGFRLVAKYDLLAIEPGKRMVILDWKTSQKRPRRDYLQDRIQTHLYPFLLVLAGKQLNMERSPDPGLVEMIYWYPEFPDQPERFEYDQALFAKDMEFFSILIHEIDGLHPGEFHLAHDEKNCRFCVYRSLCDRGTRAGNLMDGEDEGSIPAAAPLDFDIDQLGAIEF